MTHVQGAEDEARKPRPSIRLSIEDVGKFVGLLGVVGSLLFVGVQVRQNSIATQAATNAAVADGFREFNLMMASTPDLARAFAEYAARPEEAPPVERFLMLASRRALHVLSSAIGGQTSAPTVTRVANDWASVHLLCSDDLTKHVADDSIRERLVGMKSARQACEGLLMDALDAGGTDNITVVVGRAVPSGGAPTRTEQLQP
jgi:hypothetical protein